MALVNITEFSKKVLAAAKGKLTKKELGVLERMFTRVKKRNIILAQGLLSALKAGGSSKADIDKLSKILERANDRILEGQKEPFTPAEKKTLANIFDRANLSPKAEAKFKHNVESDADDLLVSQIAESIHRQKQKKFEFVPEKSTKQKPLTPSRTPSKRTNLRR